MRQNLPYTIKDGEGRHSVTHPSATTQSVDVPSGLVGVEGSPLQTLLSRLSKHSGRGPQYKAKCPNHDDRSPSLSIKELPDGQVLVFCHGGCDTEDVCRSVGLSTADLFPSSQRQTQIRKPRRPSIDALMVNRLLKASDPGRINQFSRELAVARLFARLDDPFEELALAAPPLRDHNISALNVLTHLNYLLDMEGAA